MLVYSFLMVGDVQDEIEEDQFLKLVRGVDFIMIGMKLWFVLQIFEYCLQKIFGWDVNREVWFRCFGIVLVFMFKLGMVYEWSMLLVVIIIWMVEFVGIIIWWLIFRSWKWFRGRFVVGIMQELNVRFLKLVYLQDQYYW